MIIEGLPVRDDPYNELIYRFVDIVQFLLVLGLFYFALLDYKIMGSLCVFGLVFSLYLWKYCRV